MDFITSHRRNIAFALSAIGAIIVGQYVLGWFFQSLAYLMLTIFPGESTLYYWILPLAIFAEWSQTAIIIGMLLFAAFWVGLSTRR